MKTLLKRLLFGKPFYMNIYRDKYGNKYGGTIHKEADINVVDYTAHIDTPTYLGKIEIY